MSPQEFGQWMSAPAALRRPLVMGVLNVTPDSFSDGARYWAPTAACEQAQRLIADGADLIDVGGESTRPGAARVDAAEQIRRVRPVFEALAGRADVVLSIDTTRAAVARAALESGASMVNDISGGHDDADLLPLVAARGAYLVLMHMKGQPATMQANPTYDDVTDEVMAGLRGSLELAVAAGVDRGRILLDPGIGFGKTTEHNLVLLRDLPRFKALGRPLLLGTSRKGFIGKIADEPLESRRLFGTAATVAWCVASGADIVRVHDVAEMAKVVRVVQAIRTAQPAGATTR